MAERKFLHSWKEIAKYTGRGVRTLQHYETEFGFPVHRPTGTTRSAVLAFSDEIDTWLNDAPTRIETATVPLVEQILVAEIMGFRQQSALRNEGRLVAVQFIDAEGKFRELAIPFEEAVESLLKGLLTIKNESGYLSAS